MFKHRVLAIRRPEGSWELPAGRTLRITAIGDARVKNNVTEELAKVSGTLRLMRGLDIFRGTLL